MKTNHADYSETFQAAGGRTVEIYFDDSDPRAVGLAFRTWRAIEDDQRAFEESGSLDNLIDLLGLLERTGMVVDKPLPSWGKRPAGFDRSLGHVAWGNWGAILRGDNLDGDLDITLDFDGQESAVDGAL